MIDLGPPYAPFLPERIRDRLAVDEATLGAALGPCWLWMGERSAHGYGYVIVKGRRWRVHRYALAASGTRLDDTLVVDHLCRVRACANPWHLEQVTPAENTRRGLRPRRGRCRRGHDTTRPESLYVRPNGVTECRACRRARRVRRAA